MDHMSELEHIELLSELIEDPEFAAGGGEVEG
jgi:hypothetical protein